jgi:hypothetical protein
VPDVSVLLVATRNIIDQLRYIKDAIDFPVELRSITDKNGNAFLKLSKKKISGFSGKLKLH